MDYINQGAAALNSSIDSAVTYVQENGFAILVLLALIYWLRKNVSKFGSAARREPGGHVLAEQTINATTREEELRMVRLRQQELANERAKEAARLKKLKEQEDRQRKNHVAKTKEKGVGDKIGKSSLKDNSSGGFNHLLGQPGASYRPQRRSVNRG